MICLFIIIDIMNTHYDIDLHTHTVSSGHGSHDTVTDLVREAKKRGLKVIGISDHGPATPGSAVCSYFRNISLAQRRRFDIEVLYGVELNILDKKGHVDLEEDILEGLDYAFISMHNQTYRAGSPEDNTEAYISAMNHKKVRFLGHPEDGNFPVNYERLLRTARDKGVYPELNNASLGHDCNYRRDAYTNSKQILDICKRLELPVLLSSDSHGIAGIGNFQYALKLIEDMDFPGELILNGSLDRMRKVIGFV